MNDLLKPRYIVEMDFYQGQHDIKYNQIKAGDIFMNYMPQQTTVWRRVSGNKWEDVTIHCPEQYPHLFRPLSWWEHREEKEMPKYIKDRHGVYEVEKWQSNGNEVKPELICLLKEPYDGFKDWYPQNLYGIEPSNETEYQQYLKTKEVK